MKRTHGSILGTTKNTCPHCKKVFTSTTSCARHIAKKICLPPEEIQEIQEVPENKIEPTEKLLDTGNVITESLHSYPVVIEEENIPVKKSNPFVSALIKTVICSIFFIPFFMNSSLHI
jgi:hypothetical protein